MPRKLPPDFSDYSLSGGMWLVLRDGTEKFSLWASLLSGREEVYWNNVLVSSSRKIALSSTHTFPANGAEYVVQLKTLELRSGMFECTLSKHGQVIESIRTEYQQRRSLGARLMAISLAGVLSFLWLRSQVPFWALLAGAVLIVCVGTTWSMRGRRFVFKSDIGSNR